MRCIVLNAFSVRAINLPTDKYPKSYAERLASSESPMLVGDVR